MSPLPPITTETELLALIAERGSIIADEITLTLNPEEYYHHLDILFDKGLIDWELILIGDENINGHAYYTTKYTLKGADDDTPQ